MRFGWQSVYTYEDDQTGRLVQNLWSDPDLLEIPAKTVDELRCLVIGKIDEKHWSAVIT